MLKHEAQRLNIKTYSVRNRAVTEYLDLSGRKYKFVGSTCTTRNFIICTNVLH